MKFGLFNLLQCPEGKSTSDIFKEELEQIQYAEEIGFHSAWIAEHHFSRYGLCGSPLLFAAAVAQSTKRIRLGLAVSVLPFGNPLHIAEEAAMVDVLSDGRLDFGVGRGYQKPEFDGFNVSMDQSRERFQEALEIIIKAWTTDSFSYDGKFTKVHNLSVLPKPVQSPHPPIWVAGVSPETIQWCGEKGYPILTASSTWARAQKNHQLFKTAMEEVGRDTSNLELPVTVYTYIADSNQKARDQSEKHIMWHFGKLAQLATPQEGESISEQYKHYPKFFGRIAELDYDFIAENLAIIGDPDHCVERLKTAESEFGVNYVVFHMNFGGISPEHVMDSLRLFAKYVMPEFKDGTG